jgi:hypothetical protein
MNTSLDEFVSLIDRLTSRLDELEARVVALEQASVSPGGAGKQAAGVDSTEELHFKPRLGSAGAMAVVGKVFLGIGGAYVLRALAEAGIFRHWAIIAVALVYAGIWLLWAARTSRQAVFAATAYATTAAIILSPMLWELTLRFKVMSAWATAAMLVLFVLASTALAWRRKLTAVIWPPAAFLALTAAALLVATADPLPFSVALLAMAVLTEVAAGSGRWLSLRPVMAIAVDFAVLALIMVYTGERTGFDYVPIGRATLLTLFAAFLAVYLISLLNRTAVQKHDVGLFEIAQTVAAFALALCGMLRVTSELKVGIGAFCMTASLVCYLLAFLRFDTPSQRPNHRVFAAWAMGLLLVGSFLSFSSSFASVWLGLAAVVATFAGTRTARLDLQFAGAVYLVTAAFLSGLIEHAAQLLVGGLPAPARWPVWTAGASAILCYVVIRGLKPLREQAAKSPLEALRLTFLSLTTYTAMAAGVALGLLAAPEITVSRLAALRTLVICLCAVTVGWSGSRLRQSEMIWLAYAAIGFCSLKLVFEDLRYGNAGTLAFSLFCCGIVWLLVPRFARTMKAD